MTHSVIITTVKNSVTCLTWMMFDMDGGQKEGMLFQKLHQNLSHDSLTSAQDGIDFSGGTNVISVIS